MVYLRPNLQTQTKELLGQVRKAVSARHDELFTRFLPLGYEMTTLSCVEPDDIEKIILTKVRIGTLITIYDDLADNPKLRNRTLLSELYRLPFARSTGSEHPIFHLVDHLWSEVLSTLETLPGYPLLRDIFEFDVEQFYNANRYSELVSASPALSNQTENRAYMPHNMGIIIVGMVDLMASRALIPEELGRARAFLYECQTIARMMNVLTTTEREVEEGDVTGELVASLLEQGQTAAVTAESMIREMEILFAQVTLRAKEIRAFDAERYVEGLKSLQKLHDSMRSVI